MCVVKKLFEIFSIFVGFLLMVYIDFFEDLDSELNL
jgi:hypothetical protein